MNEPAKSRSDEVDSALRDLFDAMEDALCIIEILPDASGHVRDVRYVSANPAFAIHSGEPDIEGRTASEAFPQLERHWFENFEHVWLSGEPSRLIDRSDSLDRWFEVSLSRIGDVAARRIACLFKDVTQAKNAEARARETQERALEMAAELSEVDRRKTEFLATLAHELRNPLAPISNGLELMAAIGSDPVEFTRTRQMMARQVAQMTRLVDELLDLSRISQDKIELQCAPVALVDIVDGAVEACRPRLEQAGHALGVERPAADVVVTVDAVRMIQVLSNLLNNAINYTPDGGHITVSAAVEGENVRLSVGDDGEGLDADGLARIFEMFTQVRGETPREHGGLGIGLALSRRLVELHGGKLGATSDGLGRGSRFDVRFPAEVHDAPATDGATESEEGVARALRVLVVDDNRDAADTLARILALRGHDTSVAYTGRGALRSIAAERPEVVLLDIGLPDITGYQVALELNAMPWRERLTLIALTGWGMAADRQRSRDAGFEHHLTKPVSARRVAELLATIATIANG